MSRCTVQPSTPLWPDHVNVLLLLVLPSSNDVPPSPLDSLVTPSPFPLLSQGKWRAQSGGCAKNSPGSAKMTPHGSLEEGMSSQLRFYFSFSLPGPWAPWRGGRASVPVQFVGLNGDLVALLGIAPDKRLLGTSPARIELLGNRTDNTQVSQTTSPLTGTSDGAEGTLRGPHA
jgi:hypothetical protein